MYDGLEVIREKLFFRKPKSTLKDQMSHEFFFLLNIREALSLLDLANLYVTNLLSIFNFFSTKTTSLA